MFFHYSILFILSLTETFSYEIFFICNLFQIFNTWMEIIVTTFEENDSSYARFFLWTKFDFLLAFVDRSYKYKLKDTDTLNSKLKRCFTWDHFLRVKERSFFSFLFSFKMAFLAV